MSESVSDATVSPQPVAPVAPSLFSRLAAEVAGTFVLVFGVVGTALYAAGFADGDGGLNVGFLGVALALGLSVVVGAYAFGPVSGGHFNPAVTLGLAVGGRFAWRDVIGYILAQIVGGALATTLLVAIAAGGPDGFLDKAMSGGFASTGWGELSPGGFPLLSALLVEIITTAVFVYVILGVTSTRAADGFAPLAIGLTLTMLALIAIPVSNASFNPARSIATAIYGGPTALAQVWLSIVAPIVGALIAGSTFKLLFDRSRPQRDLSSAAR
ncbi:aquaporin Z [Leifsonia poae]|uniref:Aquaporin Z n=1 Tax=Leifsonia poae TaxID=110933 RepID=A0A9W6H808_9MICO|nr:aquaporin Z [Leifsonia poae]GLJ75310.1 aquaporin Z [Leifsonia poae]